MQITASLPLEHIDQIIHLAKELGLAQWSHRDYLKEPQREDSLQLVAIDEQNQLLGFLIGRCRQLGDSEILNIGVAPAFQRQGIASLLLDKFLAACDGTVWLEAREANFQAIGFYQRRGFLIVGRRPNYYASPTENAVIMKLTRT